MIWLLGLISALLVVYYFLIKPQLYWYFKNVKQGFPVPILGDSYLNIFQRISNMDLQKKLYSQFPNQRYRGFYLATVPTLMLQDPELFKQIAIKDFDHFVDHRDFTPPKVDPIWAKNLLSLKGEEWRNMRSILSPAFTSSKMKAMFSLMNESGEQYLKHFLDQDKPLIELEMKNSFSRFAIDVIANCAFGVISDSQKETNNPFYKIAMLSNPTSSFAQTLKFFLNSFAPKILEIFNLSIFSKEAANFVEDLVVSSIEYREKHHVVRPDLIHLLMEAKKGRLKYEEDKDQSKSTGFATVEESDVGKAHNSKTHQLTNFDLAAQAMIFLIAGFDTISTALSFTVLELAQNPFVQEKLRKEIDEHYRATNGKLTYDTLAKMKYLDMVTSETLRKYPAFIAHDRVCVKPYTISPVLPDEKPLHLSVGQSLWIPVCALHHDPKYYPEPDRYDPERFSDENKDNIKPYTYLPFGIGPRNCIGSRFALMEMKTLLFHLLSKFEITAIEKTMIPITISKKSFNPMIDGGFWVGLKKRNDAVII